MEELKKRIKEEGRVIPPDILKVDSFLNHQIDVELFDHMGQAFYEHFKEKSINKILTIESSGIGVAVMVARYFNNVPVVFIKKSTSKITNENVYRTQVHSFTKNKDYMAQVSQDYLSSEDHILFVDDFLANGEAALGALSLCNQAHATIEGMGIVIEKGFQEGRKKLEDRGMEVYSLAIIDHFENNEVYFTEGK